MSAAPVRRPEGYIDILVDGVAQRRYAHEGRWYVEALKGQEYAIRIRNPYGVRVAVALSVDGLNTIDARQTTAAAARKWVLEPYETVTISGWQTSRTEARRFEFTTEERSYGQRARQDRQPRYDLGRLLQGAPSKPMTKAAKDARSAVPRQRRRRPQDQRADASASSAKKAEDEYAATGWADAPATPSPRCGWISKTRPRRP